MRFSHLLWLLLLGAATTSGCTHAQLRYNVVHQANSVNDIFEKQVLDNLAMFMVKPQAIPSFSYPDTGASNVTDSGAVSGVDPSSSFFSKVFSLSASRQNYDQWTLVPIRDPQRLSLMRCAYQRAVGYGPPDNCPDCCELDRTFHGIDKDKYDCDDPCSIQPGWVCCSTNWGDVPKCCHSRYGHYCGTYVWVQPGAESHFSTLVLTILDYAISDFAEPVTPLKHVTFYIDETGKAVKKEEALGEVSADINASDPVSVVLDPANGGTKASRIHLRVPAIESTGGQSIQRYQQLLRGATPPTPLLRPNR